MELIGTKICKKSDIGIHDNLFGGTMLSWIDEAAVSMASAVCYTPNMVTLKMDEVLFQAPVKVNMQIKIYGEVAAIGRTSITLRIEARRFSVYTHEEQLVCSTGVKFVRIDEDGSAIPIAKNVKDEFGHLKD